MFQVSPGKGARESQCARTGRRRKYWDYPLAINRADWGGNPAAKLTMTLTRRVLADDNLGKQCV
jgi:hypothetical protein